MKGVYEDARKTRIVIVIVKNSSVIVNAKKKGVHLQLRACLFDEKFHNRKEDYSGFLCTLLFYCMVQHTFIVRKEKELIFFDREDIHFR